MRYATAALAAVLLFPTLAAAQSALDLLQRVSARYRQLIEGVFDFEWIEVRESSGAYRHRDETRHHSAADRGRTREETLPDGMLHISDGQYQWSINRTRNEYVRTRQTVRGSAGLTTFSVVAYRANSARLLREETLRLQTGPVACQVFEVGLHNLDGEKDSPGIVWVDAQRELILRFQERRGGTLTDVTVVRANLGGPIDPSLFRYAPPPGAVQVERLAFGEKLAASGQSAPDFELQSLGGEIISNRSARGGPLLLIFALRMEENTLAVAELAHRALAAKGLTVLYVAHDRWGRLAAPSGFTAPIALDPGGETAKKFGVSLTGTVLIDRAGMCVYAERGSSAWLELARRLQKLGVW